MLTVARDFEPRAPSMPACLNRSIRLGQGSVFGSFSAQTDGSWRSGALGAQKLFADPPLAAQAGPEDRPWLSLDWSAEGGQLRTPEFPVRGGVQIRYTIEARAQWDGRVRRWEYCDLSDGGDGERASTELVLSDHDKDLVVRRDAETGCLQVEAPAPPPPRLSARYGVYRVGGGAWWWRVELAAPEQVPRDPAPPAAGPVVFVVDASRSARQQGGLVTQLAIVDAYIKNMPAAEVELILTSRTAERVFGRLVPAAEVSAAMGSLENTDLKNGSFLDRGAELAARVVAESGRPGRVLLMTDAQLPSRYDQRSAAAALRRAPPGTTVHVIAPDSRPSPPSVERILVWEDIDALTKAFGGDTYAVGVDSREPRSASLDSVVQRLVVPDRFEALALHDPSGEEWPPSPEEYTYHWGLDDAPREPTLLPGSVMVWRATTTRRPPEHLLLTAWVGGQKHELRLARDAALEPLLPRLVTSEAWCTLDAAASWNEAKGGRDDPWRLLADHAKRDGFLAPRLAFWVSGSGDTEVYRYGDDWRDCSAGYGHGTLHVPTPVDFVSVVRGPLQACGLEPTATGLLRVKVEVERNEILDVAVEGAGDERRRCAEEAIWGTLLPDDFNGQNWGRVKYTFGLSPSPTP